MTWCGINGTHKDVRGCKFNPAICECGRQPQQTGSSEEKTLTDKQALAILTQYEDEIKRLRAQVAALTKEAWTWNAALTEHTKREYAALAAQQAPVQPAGGLIYWHNPENGQVWSEVDVRFHCKNTTGWTRIALPQPAAPAQPPAKVEREGLTDEQVRQAFRDYDTPRGFARGQTPWQIWRDAAAWAIGIPTPTVGEKESGNG